MAAFERNDTAAKIVDIVVQKLNRDKGSVQELMTFQELNADSLDMVEIIMRIEEVFGIEVNDDDAEKLVNLAQTIDYVHALRTK